MKQINIKKEVKELIELIKKYIYILQNLNLQQNLQKLFLQFF